MPIRSAFAIALLAAASAAPAAVFRDVQYTETVQVDPASQRLDVYTPDSPGPHAVLVVLHGAGDKSALPFAAASLAARGYLVASVRTRPANSDGAAADAYAAIEWIRAHASGYGGDRDRVVLVGVGDGTVPAATVAASVPGAAALRGLIVLDAAPLDAMVATPDVSALNGAIPPHLVLRSNETLDARRPGERWIDRMRGTGTAVQVLPRDRASAGDDGFGPMLGWLAALDVPRVQRFETLTFTAQAIRPGGRIAALRAHGHALYALATYPDGVVRVLRRAGPDRPWAVETGYAGDSRDGLWLGTIPSTRDGDDRLALLVASGEGWMLRTRDPRTATWSATPLATGSRASNRPVVTTHRDAAGPALFIASAPGRLLRLQMDSGGALRSDAIVAPPARLTALVTAGGALYAASEPARALGPTMWRLAQETGTWHRQRTLPDGEVAIASMTAVPDPTGVNDQVLLLAAGSRVLRVDPRDRADPVVELDLSRTFADLWGPLGGDGSATIASEFVLLRQPETGDAVHLAGVAVTRSNPPWPGAYYLVRQFDGRYAYGFARDFAVPETLAGAPQAIVAIAASPFASDAGRVVYAGGVGGAGPALLSGRLARAGPARGLWWDRSRSGHGLALEPTVDGYMLILYTYARDGSPTWFVARGNLAAGSFIADADGLSRPAAPGSRIADTEAGAMRAGDVTLRFDIGADEAACADADRRDALQLAALDFDLDGTAQQWCLEPFAFGPVGAPTVAARGVWAPESDPDAWGLSLATQGLDRATRLVAVLFHFDGAGQPRWALGAGPILRGEAELALDSLIGTCPGCASAASDSTQAGRIGLRFRGWCGEVRGEVAFELDYPGPEGGGLRRDGVAIAPRSLAGCY